MPRPKTRTDEQILDAALELVHAGGVERLTLAAVGERCGLSAATLVQRFGTKATLTHRALWHAWDRLDASTAELAAAVPKTPEGAVELLIGLSRQYGDDVATYRGGLLVLHEDLGDPSLRARGSAWERALTDALDECFASTRGAPSGIGHVLASHWQGALTWWAFDASSSLPDYLTRSLDALIAMLVCASRADDGTGAPA
ncbi:TetR family transcriptional regulator [Actinomycetospora sp. NBRC 106375]|uniref:TetR/AcrR family transcriptional regulator n=1 Tax=Actinomycetospora sp. NBRC 106375 TaxID=3032207 RepID=UPI0024A107DC|nr:TetR/AcrR family transcriptional regulator [Actinomycetospora sp. NBRC 106375]GLZ48173.1 TetR family transcriptional regulator [Actinomycetospora sp. NBRC 106375]